MHERNWAGNSGYRATALHRPTTLDQVRELVAGATHGSGDGNGNLATAVAGLELVTASGDVLTVSRGDDDFEGLIERLDPRGVFTNDWLRSHVLGR